MESLAIIIAPLYHSILELLYLFRSNIKSLSKTIAIGLSAFVLISSLGHYKLATWCLYWVFLGILSSIGFGFGLHTFVLFLAPHITTVTIAAHRCKSLDFPQPPYPEEIICPDNGDQVVTFANILYKVALESFMWGLGTAIGEIPPYLAARLKAQASGRRSSNIEDDVSGWELWLIRLVTRIGFVGTVLFAAIPNPLFDLAGLASGIAQVSFLSFFGATVIGKAIIKVTLQASFIVFIFHSNNLELLVQMWQEKFPYLRRFDLSRLVDEQRNKVLRVDNNDETPMISSVFSWLTTIIMTLFLISMIKALDKQYRDRVNKKAK